MSIDQVLFAAIKTRLEASSVITNNRAVVCRDDWPESLRVEEPSILYSPISAPEDPIFDATFDLTVQWKRGDSVGPGSNPQNESVFDQVKDAVLNQMVGWVPTISGYAASAVSLRYRYRTTYESRETITWRRKYGCMVIRGGTQVPMSGGEGTLTMAAINGVVRGWQVNVRRPLMTDHTQRADSSMRVRVGDPIAAGSFDLALTKRNDATNPLPVTGSLVSAVFVLPRTGSPTTITWTDSLLIYDYTWLTGPTAPVQVVRVSFAVENANSPFLASP